MELGFLDDYSLWVTEISKKYNVKPSNELNVYLSGLVEEIAEHEYEKSETEIGDVLCYWMLCVNHFGSSATLLLSKNKVAAIPSPWYLVKELSGQLKRLNRGDENEENLMSALALTLFYIDSEIKALNTSFLEVIKINKEKLESRKAFPVVK